jgi:WD40 repeat protein
MTAALSGHRGHVLAVAVDGRAGLVASGGEDRTLRLWSLAQGKPLAVIGGPSAPVSAVALARGAVLAGSVDRSLRAWDQGRSALIRVERLEGPVHALHAGPQGVWAASGAAVHLVAEGGPRLPGYLLARPVSAREVETRDAAFLQRLADARRSLTQGDVGRALALAREARTVPGHERSEAALALWDDVTALLPRRGLASAWEAASLEGHRDPVLAVAVGGDGAQAVSGDLVGVVRAWDLGRRADRGVLGAHDATVAGVAVAPDGRHAVSGSWDRTVRVWDLGTRKLARTLTAHEDYVNGVAVSPDGRRVLSASSDRTLRLWDLASGRPLATLAGHEAQVSSCVFGPDGRFALSGGWDATVRAWDAQTREGVFVLEGHEDSVGAVAVSPDGRQAASGGLDRTVRVWDLRSRRCVRVFAGHAAEVTAVAFFLDGRYLASASRDKTVRVWDGATGEATRTLALTGAVLSLAPLPAANGLLTAGTDLALRLWRLEWEPEARAAPAWDEKASAHLQTLMSLRTMPGTGTRVTEADLDTIVRDLRNRGFGGLRRETVAAHVRDLAASGETLSPWEEIRRAAPRAAAREVAVKAARGARRKLPPLRVALAAAAAVASVALGLFLFRTQRTVLGYARHQVARFADDPFHVELPAAGASCVATGYEEYLAQAREPLVSTRVLGCLAHLNPPGIVEAYLATMQLADDDSALATRRRRNAVSLMAALGEPGLPSLCAALATGGADARWVAARALAAQGLPAAAECLFDRARHPDVGVRLAVVGVLPWLFGRETVEPARAWEITQVVLADGDPRVRRAALDAVAFFDWDHASDTLQRVEKDADAELAQAAAGLRKSLNTHRKLNPDRPY